MKDHWWYNDADYEPMFDIQFGTPEETINSADRAITTITATIALRHMERLPDKTLRRWSGDIFFMWRCEMEGHALAEEMILKVKNSMREAVCSQLNDSFLYAIHKPIDAV
jgi:hypothetical protein